MAAPDGLLSEWGSNLRRRRESIGLSQERVAELALSTQATISRIEKGLQAPSEHLKWRLAGALGVTVGALFPTPNVRPPIPTEGAA